MRKNANKVEKTKTSLYLDLIVTSLLAFVVAIIIAIAVIFIKRMESYEKAMTDLEESYNSRLEEDKNNNFEIILEE